MKKIFYYVMMALVLCTMTLTSCKGKNDPEINLTWSEWVTKVQLGPFTEIHVYFTEVTDEDDGAGKYIEIQFEGMESSNANGPYKQNGKTIVMTITSRGNDYVKTGDQFTGKFNDSYTSFSVDTEIGTLVFDKVFSPYY